MDTSSTTTAPNYAALVRDLNKTRASSDEQATKVRKEAAQLERVHQLRSVKHVGSGTFGRVYRVVKGEKTYAVKVMDLASEDDGVPTTTIRELALLVAMDHEHVLKIHGFTLNGLPFFALLDYVPWTLIDLFLKPIPGTDKEQEIDVSDHTMRTSALQLLRGLEYMHARAIFHRDLKPNNILMHDDGRLVIADFGISRAAHYTQNIAAGTAKADVCTGPAGTREYAPPEVTLANLTTPTKHGHDMWSLGCCLAFLAIKKTLFNTTDPEELMYFMHFKLGPPPPDAEVCALDRYKAIDQAKWKNDTSRYLPPEPSLRGRLSRSGMSSPMVDLTLKLLQWKVCERPTASQAIDHPAFSVLRGLETRELLSYKDPGELASAVAKITESASAERLT